MSQTINSSMLHNGCTRYSFRVRPNGLFLRTGRATSISRVCSLNSRLQHNRYIGDIGACSSTSKSRNLTTFAPASAAPAIVQSPTSVQEIDTYVDTVYALSTGAGVRAGIAIVRISGPACLQIYQALCPSKPPPEVRYATLRTLFDPADNQIILDSSALVLFFPGPNTVTGENVLELHIHGGVATVKAVLSAIPRCSSNTRMAEPGEFTRRAFQNGRLDLAQVEALSDTLAAETEQQRRAAVRGNSRKLGETYDGWRQQLLYARGELEALIDFSEDQHFDESPAELLRNVTTQVRDMVLAINHHEYTGRRGDLLRRGIEIALIGPPNAGKSSLLNLIVGREASIVSSEAGTTRDIVEVRYDIGGYLCTFADTAGLRKAKDKLDVNSTSVVGNIEQEGIKRAKARAGDSDLIIILASIEQAQSHNDQRNHWIIQYDAESLSHIYINGGELHKPSIIVVNKCDAASPEIVSDLIRRFQKDLMQMFHLRGAPLISSISCLEATVATNSRKKDPGDIRIFTTQLSRVIESMTDIPAGSEDLLGVTERQRQLLSACKEHLMGFVSEASNGMSSEDENIETDIVIAAEHLRSAADCLSRITGRGLAGDVEEVLGVVFEKFCVGK